MSKSRSVGILCGLLLVGAASGALSATNVATSPSPQQAVIAAVKRLVPEGCEAREIRFLSEEALEIVGQCASASRIAAFMQSQERAGGKPGLVSVEMRAGGHEFKMRLLSLQTFAIKGDAN